MDLAGKVEYFSGYAWEVFDCNTCGCRYTRHDNSVYDLLHNSGAISYYDEYRELAEKAKMYFDRKDPVGLKTFLSHATKYRFILAEIERAPADARVLEVGCSRGYLTSYSILQGRNILGTDVSAEAVRCANHDFGEHFALAGDPIIAARGPYDIIYHVGMIGCVADPVGFTNSLIAMLKPGGKLLFNAPNLAACWMKGQLWFDTAPPPDLVTLYPSKFWADRFAERAEVRVGLEHLGTDQSFAIGMRRLFGRRWRPPHAQAIDVRAHALSVRQRFSAKAWTLFERIIGRLARMTRLSNLVPRWPTEFGLYVIARRR